MKTIGRTKPLPDRTLVNESIAAHEEWANGVDEEKQTPRERAAVAEIISLKRQLAQAQSRAEAFAMGCDPRNPARPVMTAFEREREFERLLMEMGDMAPEARAAAVSKLIEDTKGYVSRRNDFHNDVDRELAKNRR
jgi:hypothetical protein